MRNKLFKQMFIALGAFALALAAQAQPFIPSWSSANPVSVPATLAPATTTNLATPLLIDASKQRNVSFTIQTAWSTAGESTGQTNVIYTLAPTSDKIHCDTNHLITLTAQNFSTAGWTNCLVTNLDSFGNAGWYIIKIQNTSAGGVATNQFSYPNKFPAP